jgi:hypothetical protein
VATGVLGVGTALLPAGAAASASSRILASLPSQPAVQAPVITGVTATNDPATGTTVSGYIVTSDEGFWFVQYGTTSGDYPDTEFGGTLKAMASDVFRVGFTTNNTGLTAYSKGITV